ncbi:MAG: HAD-IA family hydrolase [bacterium]|nr:HAD-IA family hydrolase [bacterium]
MKPELILFDLDGTMVNTSRDLTDSLNFALSQLGFPQLTCDQVISLVGHGVKETVFKGLPADNRQMLEDAYPLFLEHYSEHCADKTFLYPDIEKVLEHFRDKKLAVTTNKRSLLSEKILCRHGILDRFEAVLGPDRVENKKPHPDHLRAALKITESSAAKTVLIGDSLADVEAAQAAGIAVCAVTYGYTARDVLAQGRPDYLIDCASELIDLF